MIERGRPLATQSVDFGQRVKRSRLPRLVPGGFVERGVRFRDFGLVELRRGERLKPQAESELIERFAVRGIWIPGGQPCNARAKVAFGTGELSATKMPAPKREVAARVARIPPQRFAPIIFRAARRMTVLLEMHSYDEQFVAAGRLRWRRWFRRR